MSVPTGLRGENLSTVFTLALDLLQLCIHTAMNDKCFPHKFTRELGEPFVATAREIMHSVYAADKDRRPEERGRHIEDAFVAMNRLQAELHLNFLHFRLKSRSAKAGEIYDRLEELRSKFTNWSKAVS